MNRCACRHHRCPYGYEICRPSSDDAALDAIVHPRPNLVRLPDSKRAVASFRRLLPRVFSAPPQG